MQAIVLVGGQGTRLRSVVSELPKVMAPIGERPFLSLLLDRLQSQGVDDVILAVGYLRDLLMAHFGPRHNGIALRYAVETEPLGTGGALRNALTMVERFPVFALNGDTYLELDYRAMREAHETAGVELTIALRRVVESRRYGCVTLDGDRIVEFAAQGAGTRLVSAGVYLFAGRLLDDPTLPKSFSFERDFLEQRVPTLRPLAFETTGYFIDIGVPEDYRLAQRELPGRVPQPAAPLAGSA
jgi:D-glycero-alpha-D-manno-heptose 1-phosphate guanylyltransferase